MGRGWLKCLKYLESGNLYLKVLAGHQKGHVFCEFIGNILHLCMYILECKLLFTGFIHRISTRNEVTLVVSSQLWGVCVIGLTGMFTRWGLVGGMDDIPSDTPAIQTAMQLRLP